MTDSPYLTHMRSMLDHSIRSLVASSVEHSLNLDTAAARSASEAHLAGAVAYVLSVLHDEAYDLSQTIAAQLEEWADDGEDLGWWVAKTAERLGVDPEKIITEMRATYVPQPEGWPAPAPGGAEATAAPSA